MNIHDVIIVITDGGYSLLIGSFLDILKAFKVRHQQQLVVGGNKQVDDVLGRWSQKQKQGQKCFTKIGRISGLLV